MADSPAKLDAIDIRQHPVEKHEFRRSRCQQNLPCLRCILGNYEVKTPFSETAYNQLAVDNRIFCNENLHSLLSAKRTPHRARHLHAATLSRKKVSNYRPCARTAMLVS